MSDIFSILKSSYTSNVPTAASVKASKVPYKNVDPKQYEGNWTGSYKQTKQKFALRIYNVSGFHATAQLETGGQTTTESVMIRGGSFRIGNTKFLLEKTGVALVTTAATNSITGAVVPISGTATKST